MKKSNFYILLYFIVIIAVAALTSCASTQGCHDTFNPPRNGSYNSHGTDWW